jgi:flavin-dependent dehydrogenase
MVADNAVKAGATVWQDAEATAPVIDRGLVRGAIVNDQEVRADYVVIADGANSRFGRAIGTARDRAYPQGMAIRGYYESPLHADPWIESALDVKDRNGNALPGYGWIFPVGDGTVNVGVGLLSTFRDYRSVNTTHLLNEYVATAPAYWEISAERAVGDPTGGRLPMGGSVGPKVGPTFVVVGDAAAGFIQRSTARASTTRTRPAASLQVLHEALSTATASRCSSTRSCSRPNTASTSRWLASSHRSSGVPR